MYGRPGREPARVSAAPTPTRRPSAGAWATWSGSGSAASSPGPWPARSRSRSGAGPAASTPTGSTSPSGSSRRTGRSCSRWSVCAGPRAAAPAAATSDWRSASGTGPGWRPGCCSRSWPSARSSCSASRSGPAMPEQQAADTVSHSQGPEIVLVVLGVALFAPLVEELLFRGLLLRALLRRTTAGLGGGDLGGRLRRRPPPRPEHRAPDGAAPAARGDLGHSGGSHREPLTVDHAPRRASTCSRRSSSSGLTAVDRSNRGFAGL